MKQPPELADRPINFVNKMKMLFGESGHTYRAYTEIMEMYLNGKKPVEEVCTQITHLLKKHADLLAEFTLLLPKSIAGFKLNDALKRKDENNVDTSWRLSHKRKSAMKALKLIRACSIHAKADQSGEAFHGQSKSQILKDGKKLFTRNRSNWESYTPSYRLRLLSKSYAASFSTELDKAVLNDTLVCVPPTTKVHRLDDMLKN